MRVAVLVVLAGLAGGTAGAWESEERVRPDLDRGSLVSLQVSVEGRDMPLYASADGRYYVEARKGAAYELQITNRSGQRVGVELTVDGLNVISGERDRPGPDRMYVLGPWDNTSIRGWRSSLDEVRTFTFVDEKASYSARAGKANGKMGWIEMAVYREHVRVPPPPPVQTYGDRESRNEKDEAPRAAGRAAEAPAAAPDAAYPGTGWGDPLRDRVRLVDFEPERGPAQQMTLRYEYRAALVALGILPKHHSRLEERERGEGGFAKPPRW